MNLIKKIKKDNILFFVIGAIVFGGISTVVATTILSSSVSYTNNNQTTVEGALDDLYGKVNIVCYNGVCGRLAFRYWNDGFSNTTYPSNGMPANNYKTRALLEENYSGFATQPFYIRSVLINENVVGHQACLWSNNREICISPGYWAGTLNVMDSTAATQTKIKIQRDMQNALSVTIPSSDCDIINDDYSWCSVGSFFCTSYSSGAVNCGKTNEFYCRVYGDGNTICKN